MFPEIQHAFDQGDLGGDAILVAGGLACAQPRDGLLQCKDVRLDRAQRMVERAGELAQLVRGEVAGRQAADEITLFKSVGTAIEDLVAARLLLQNASD